MVTADIKKYNDEPLPENAYSEGFDLLGYWEKNKKRFKILYKVAKYFHTFSATSVPSERLFSDAGYTIWDRRTKLSPTKVNKILVIYENLKSKL